MTRTTAVTRQTLTPGEYRYSTPIGGFGLSRTSDGWVIAQYDGGKTTIYGTYPTMRDADAAMLSLFS